MHNEIWEDLVARNTCWQQFGLRRIVREESRTYIYKYQRNGDIQQAAKECRFHRLGCASCRHISLYVVLVNAIVLHIGQQTIDKYYPECWLGKSKAETTERELIVCGGNLK